MLLRIATRGSALALAQANIVARRLAAYSINSELLVVNTTGDLLYEQDLKTIGGKGLFLKEIQEAILSGHADLAVHSLKDMPFVNPDGLRIAAILSRCSPHDVLISNNELKLAELPSGAKVGTCSARREAILKKVRPDLVVLPMRGNVTTRLAKLAANECDAIILAKAGLERLDKQSVITEELPLNVFVPAVGQGAIAVECASANYELHALLAQLNCPATAWECTLEREFMGLLNADCGTPIAAYAKIQGNDVHMHACYFQTDRTYEFKTVWAKNVAHAALISEIKQWSC